VINTFARLHRLIIGSSKQQKLISVFFKASTHNSGCVQGLSMRVIVAICGSFSQDGAVDGLGNVTNYPSGISHKHTCWFTVSPENLCMCRTTHTQLFGGHSGV